MLLFFFVVTHVTTSIAVSCAGVILVASLRSNLRKKYMHILNFRSFIRKALILSLPRG